MMKLTIATPIKRFSLSLPDEDADSLFDNILGNIISSKSELSAKTYTSIGIAHDTPQAMGGSETWVNPDFEPEPNVFSYRGFLYIKCPHCGSEHGFCSKSAMQDYVCRDCGESFMFDKEFVELLVKCECGGDFKYLTNVTNETFDISCVRCGAPVSVQFNNKKQRYETIGR